VSAKHNHYEGMAHKPGGGPNYAICGGCAHWGASGEKGLRRPCTKFIAMTGVRSRPVPATADACRLFSPKHPL
jgi:hypothetical protein